MITKTYTLHPNSWLWCQTSDDSNISQFVGAWHEIAPSCSKEFSIFWKLDIKFLYIIKTSLICNVLNSLFCSIFALNSNKKILIININIYVKFPFGVESNNSRLSGEQLNNRPSRKQLKPSALCALYCQFSKCC